ncbi:hypothetical protein N9N13_02685 [Opitutales bacterium]|nr:hypothetical protein [Opitutales bacterium]
MKLKFFSLISLLVSGGFIFAQMPGMMTMQQASAPQGTTLGANTTSGATGIALGNRVVMRGYVDFVFKYDDNASISPTNQGQQTEAFNTYADVDFLFDFSPVTAELHVAMTKDDISLEQAFGRYSLNRDFNFSFGRQLTVLGYEADEAPGLFAVSNAYYLGDKASSAQTRRNYKDGVRANFNNGRFGVTVGLHDGYWAGDDFTGNNIALDIAGSLMIIPGLEARLGYAFEEVDKNNNTIGITKNKDISQFNAWLGYNPGDLTLALEFDNYDILDDEYWSMMLLANYQFVDWMGATIRYSHEDYEMTGSDHEADRFSFALLFSLTQNFGINMEYSTTSVDSAILGDYDEFYVEGLLTF